MTSAAAARRSPSPMTRVRTRSRAGRALLRERLRRKQLEETEGTRRFTAERDKQANEEHEEEEGREEESVGIRDGLGGRGGRADGAARRSSCRRAGARPSRPLSSRPRRRPRRKRRGSCRPEERKRETRDLVAETIRREEEQNEVHLDGNGSEADMPDDADVDEAPASPEFEIEFEDGRRASWLDAGATPPSAS